MKKVKTLAEVMAENDAQRKQDGLFALANLAEREGRLDEAIALAKMADAVGPSKPYATAMARLAKYCACGECGLDPSKWTCESRTGGTP